MDDLEWVYLLLAESLPVKNSHTIITSRKSFLIWFNVPVTGTASIESKPTDPQEEGSEDNTKLTLLADLSQTIMSRNASAVLIPAEASLARSLVVKG